MSKKLFTMKPENILKTDWLDILFENKNKNYGAYNLRKFYNDRLKKSLGITALLVLVFAGLQSW
jgi:protein TonB